MKRVPIVPFAVGTLVLLGGAAVMVVLLSFRESPAGASVSREEKPIHVAATAVQPEDVPVFIAGYGEVRVLKEVEIAPEVSGKVVEVHPNMAVGGIVPQGDALLRIDPRPFRVQVEDMRALAAQQESGLQHLNAQWDNERERLKTVDRSRVLAQAQFERAKQLAEEGIGSSAEVDEAEQTYISSRDEVEQLTRTLNLYPFRLAEAESGLASAQAKLAMAEMDLENCRVVAPFGARVKSVSVEEGQYVTAGRAVLTLADDSILEISVPLNSRDARRWLRFSADPSAPGAAWFTSLEQAPCSIRWTEESDGHTWEGVLERVESFDRASRTLAVAVRIQGAQALAKGPDRFPLVEGMFCEVRIPGHTMRGVYRLALGTVSFNNTVLLAADNHLRTVPVEVARVQDDFVFVSDGLSPGDLVITTRLVNPLENSLLEVAVSDEDPAP